MSYPPPYPGGYPPQQQGYQMPQQQLGFGFAQEVNPAQPSYCPYPSNPGFPTGQPEPAPSAFAPYPSAQGYPPQPSYQTPGNQSAFQAPQGPHPGAQQGPYPGTQQGPYPGTQQGSYPGAQQGAYPGAQQGSYSGAQQGAYPGAQQGSYPGAQQGPYPGAQQGPYPTGPVASGYPPLNDFPQSRYASQTQAAQVPPARPKPPSQRIMEEVGVPTVRPYGNFNATSDAEILRKAMKGFGTDEKAIINVLSQRTADQRMDILRAYKANFGKDLIKDLKSELSGNFERLVLALMCPRFEYLASEVYEAIKGLGTEEGTLVEVLAPRSNQEISRIAAAYQGLYGKSMEDAVASDTSGDFQRLLIAISQGLRDESPTVDLVTAQHDAHKLYSAGEGRLGTEESAFIQILATRSFPHLRQVQVEYSNITGHALEDAVKREFSGNVEKGLVAILIAARSKAEYFAYRIRNALSGAGTHDRALIRSVVSRCEVDLATVKDHYMRIYGKSMAEDISADTSGDYKKLLLALCGH